LIIYYNSLSTFFLIFQASILEFRDDAKIPPDDTVLGKDWVYVSIQSVASRSKSLDVSKYLFRPPGSRSSSKPVYLDGLEEKNIRWPRNLIRAKAENVAKAIATQSNGDKPKPRSDSVSSSTSARNVRAQSRAKPQVQVPETQTLDMNWSSNSKSARDSRAQSRAQAAAERPGTQSQQLEMDADELLGELL